MLKTILLLTAFASLIIVNPQAQASRGVLPSGEIAAGGRLLDLGVYDASHAFDKSSLRYEQIWITVIPQGAKMALGMPN